MWCASSEIDFTSVDLESVMKWLEINNTVNVEYHPRRTRKNCFQAGSRQWKVWLQNFSRYWLLNKLVPLNSLQEYHKGILNMHLNLLLMQYESVRLLTVCMRLQWVTTTVGKVWKNWLWIQTRKKFNWNSWKHSPGYFKSRLWKRFEIG